MADCWSCGREHAGGLLTWESPGGEWVWSVQLCGAPACLPHATAEMVLSYFAHCGYAVPTYRGRHVIKPDVLLYGDQEHDLAQALEQAAREGA